MICTFFTANFYRVGGRAYKETGISDVLKRILIKGERIGLEICGVRFVWAGKTRGADVFIKMRTRCGSQRAISLQPSFSSKIAYTSVRPTSSTRINLTYRFVYGISIMLEYTPLLLLERGE